MGVIGGFRVKARPLAAAALAFVACALVLATWWTGAAEAAFPGANGKIAFVNFGPRDENPRMYTANPDGTGQARLGSGLSYESLPVFSPTGQKVAFEGSKAFGNPDIYVMNSDGTGLRRLTSGRAYDSSPTWSPDGREIAFMRSPLREDGSDIYAIGVDGTGLRPITDSAGFEDTPAWSPDGQKIAFARYGRGFVGEDLFVKNASGDGPVRNLTDTPRVDEFAPDWSPDGKRIAYTSFRYDDASPREEDLEIRSMNADGTGKRNLTEHPSADLYPAFSPDGKRIAFSSNRRGNGEVFVMNADGTGVKRLTENRGFDLASDWQRLPTGATTQ